MAFEGLTEKLSNAFKKLRGKGRLSEADVKESMREIRLALLEADVNYKVVKDFIKKTTERCVGTDVLESLTPAQMIVKIVNEELTALMGSENQKIKIASQPPTVVMLVGLQGAGKTTNGAKLAGLFKKQNKNPLLAACDIYRPAAIKQLQVVGGQLGIPVFEMGQTNPVDIAKAAVAHAVRHGNDMVFLDTAGRLHVDEALMDELKAVKAAVNPDEILLVVDAMTGQDAVNVAKSVAKMICSYTAFTFSYSLLSGIPVISAFCALSEVNFIFRKFSASMVCPRSSANASRASRSAESCTSVCCMAFRIFSSCSSSLHRTDTSQTPKREASSNTIIIISIVTSSLPFSFLLLSQNFCLHLTVQNKGRHNHSYQT